MSYAPLAAPNNKQNYGGARVVTASYVIQPTMVAAVVPAPPFSGDTFVEAYGGGLFDCADHCQSCFFAWFCMPGATGKVAGFGGGPTRDNNTGTNKEENGTECLKHCCGQFLCPYFWPCWSASARNLLEARLARRHGAPPASATCGLCGDVMLHACCGCCATAQSLRAINNFKHRHGNVGGVAVVEMER
jgi:Cys-rich protein (TIGR01571 family)